MRLVGAALFSHGGGDHAGSTVSEVRWRRELIVETIDIGDWNLRKRFIRHVVKAAQIYPVHLAHRRIVSHAEGTNTTVLAEVVDVRLRVEQVLRQLRIARQQAETVSFGHRWPEARSAADGAVAAIRALREIQISFEFDGAAVATTSVGFQHE